MGRQIEKQRIPLQKLRLSLKNCMACGLEETILIKMFIYDLNLYSAGFARGKMERMTEGKQSSLQHTTESPQFKGFAVKDQSLESH